MTTSPRQQAARADQSAQGEASTMRSLERALDVLAVLERRGRPLRLSEVASDASLHVATTQRILVVLERRGLVRRDNGRYQIGVAAVPLAHAFLVGNPLSRAAAPVLQELADSSGLTASLFVRDGWSRVIIARVQGAHPLRYVLPIGERLPLHLGAGRVLLAAMTEDEVDTLLSQVGDLRLASGVALTRDDYLTCLDRIRREGYYIARSERVVGVSSVAAPVRTEAAVEAAVLVSGADDDMPPETVQRLIIDVRQAADAIARRYEHA